MNDFPGYEKIAESPDRWRLDPSAFRLFRKTEWVVTEKIHGANFCIAADGAAIRCANRRAWIASDDSFFGYEAVRDDISPRVQLLFRGIQSEYPRTTRLFLYGELFGGGYPHPEVKAALGVQPIQTGVWYAPDIHFCAFDLRIEDQDGQRYYLDYSEVVKRCDDAGIFVAAPLFIGKYEAAMDQPLRFDSTLPRALGLPDLPAGANLAEGMVIKPYREVEIRNDKGELIRPVLKRKIREFAEDSRYHEAVKWEKPAYPAAQALDLLKWGASCRIVENRLDATASKIGYIPHKTPEKASLLSALMADEVMEEVQAALPSEWVLLSLEDRQSLRGYIDEEVRQLLKTQLK